MERVTNERLGGRALWLSVWCASGALLVSCTDAAATGASPEDGGVAEVTFQDSSSDVAIDLAVDREDAMIDAGQEEAAPSCADLGADASMVSPTPGVPAAVVPGVTVRKVLDTGGGFVRIAQDPKDGGIYYMSGAADIFQLQFGQDGGAVAEKKYAASDIGGAPAVQGMAFGPDGTLYVVGNLVNGSTTQAIIRKGMLEAGTGGARTWSTLASTEPYSRSNTAFDHSFNGIAISPDGQFAYVNSGSRTDHGEVEANEREIPLTSAIFRIPTGVQGVVLKNDQSDLESNGYLYADGTRNAFELEFSPEGELFATDNGPDADYPDELNWIRPGKDYGFPWRFGTEDNPQQFSSYDPAQDHRLTPGFEAVDNGTYRNDPDFPPAGAMVFTDPVASHGPDADRDRGADGSEIDVSAKGGSIGTFTPHRSPLGLTFDREGVLCGSYAHAAFVLSYGAAGGTLSDKGQDLVRLILTRDGDGYRADVMQLVTGFDHPIDSVLVGQRLYVLTYGGSGSIWEISLPSAQ